MKNKLIKSSGKIIQYSIKYAPLESVVLLIESIVSGLVPYLEIIFVSKFVDSISMYLETGEHLNRIIIYLFGMLFSLIQYDIGDIIDDYFYKKMEYKLQLKYVPGLIEKVSHLKYQYFENENVVNLINNVTAMPEVMIADGYICVINIIQTSVALISVSLSISSNVWWAGGVVFVFCIPLLFVSYNGGEKLFELRRKTQTINRYVEYLRNISTNRENSIERTIFSGNKKFATQFITANELLRKKIFKLHRHLYFKSRGANILAFIVALTVIVILLNYTLTNTITFGVFISTSTGLLSLIGTITSSFSANLTNIAVDCEFICEEEKVNNLKTNNDDEKYGLKINDIKKIEFRNVSFKYPLSKRYVLRDVSFVLTRKAYAIVGVNGAGKSTIVKLILGLYDNYSGEILINDVDIKNFSKKEIRRNIAIVFQDYNKHLLSVKENIVIGAIEYEFDKQKYERIIKVMNLDELINKFETKDEMIIGKIVEGSGVDLSGGEWQKIAIARCLYSDASVKILDEPTSSLDSNNERKMYELFGKLSKNFLTITISHRLISALGADEILVFEDGKLVECGKPKELMRTKGVFKTIYEEQSKWYN